MQIMKERGARGWIYALVLRLPVWWRRYERRATKARPKPVSAESKGSA